MREIFPGVFRDGRRLFTKSLIKEDKTYAKSLLNREGNQYREWDPGKSKAAAAIMKRVKHFPLRPGSKVLYLGAASGATVSFFSDIVGEDGVVYAVEISERCVRDLNNTAEKRGNIVPIMADARKPEDYDWVEPVDLVFEDVASDEQSAIIIRNAEKFLKPGGTAMIAIKSRSIDVVKDPAEVYRGEISKLGKHFRITEKRELDPYEKDHMFVVMKYYS